MGKILVAYFSATGVTEKVAKRLAALAGADIFSIKPAVEYTLADLDWTDKKSRSSVEMDDPNCRPEITVKLTNMEDYDVIFLAYPIWWGEAPRIVSTFVESYDFSEKTVVPFCTSGSSGVGSSVANLEALTDGATWLSGTRLNGGSSRDEIAQWVNGLGLGITAE